MKRIKLSHSERALFKCAKDRNTKKFVSMYMNSEFVEKTVCNDDGESLLNVAIKNNAVDIALLLGDDPELINMRDKNGNPPALAFKSHINEKLLKGLIDRGMDINKRSVIMTGSKKGQECGNLLHRIALFGNKEDFDLARKYGANIESRNSKEEKPKDVLKRLNKLDEFSL
ncbi:hypothetical protein ACJO1P_04970 [Vibrio parahaemolyticus]|uniref:hypothetical protein n=1 Tax=Vibrio parahaemolyticus TaxID=670 RepID=UPI00387B9A69